MAKEQGLAAVLSQAERFRSENWDMDDLDAMDEAEVARLIGRMRMRLAEAEQQLGRDPDEAGVIATILLSLRDIAQARPQFAPELKALMARYEPPQG